MEKSVKFFFLGVVSPSVLMFPEYYFMDEAEVNLLSRYFLIP